MYDAAGARELYEQKQRLQEQVDGMKKDMDDLDAHIHKTEMDKNAKDNQIKTLNSEMALQDEQLGMSAWENQQGRVITDSLKFSQFVLLTPIFDIMTNMHDTTMFCLT